MNLEYSFVFVLIWALGGSLTEKDGEDYRKVFSNWWKNEWKVVKFANKGTVFDYYIENTEAGAKVEEWSKKVVAVDFDSVTM